jgi:hypothetical protein
MSIGEKATTAPSHSVQPEQQPIHSTVRGLFIIKNILFLFFWPEKKHKVKGIQSASFLESLRGGIVFFFLQAA